jgi:membrane-bound lytic murein transglycosylase MltF
MVTLRRLGRSARPRHGLVALAIFSLSNLSLPNQVTAQDSNDPTDIVKLDLAAPPWTGDLDEMVKRRIIRVLVPYSKTLYFVDLGGRQRGMSYDFMHEFENVLNKKLKRGNLRIRVIMIPVKRDELLPALQAGRGDVAAANITITPERSAQIDFTNPVARNVRELVVTGPGAAPLNSLDDLAGKMVFVRRASSHYDSLLTLNSEFRQRKLPQMILNEAPGHFETEDMLEMANAGLVKIVVADEYLANLWQHVYPNIQVHELAVRTDGDIAFAIRKNSPRLLTELNAYIRTHRQGTTFGNVTLQNYLEQTRWVKNATAQADLTRFNTMVGLFQKYGEQYNVDWLLMAAQGYQESQLDQRRRSSVGAIGVMQVMPATGKQMSVGDIKKLEPNIHAGVKYIRHMIDDHFNDEAIDDLNKTLFALAAYNAGPTRIKSLRRETAKRGLDPNVWFNNVERIVSQRVGAETVQYVSNIYKYYIAYSMSRQEVRQDLLRATGTQ